MRVMKKSTKAWSMKMRLALLALAALAWIAVPVSARAETNVWDGTIASGFAGGDGTQNDPFQIETAAQLAHFAKTVNEGGGLGTYGCGAGGGTGTTGILLIGERHTGHLSFDLAATICW